MEGAGIGKFDDDLDVNNELYLNDQPVAYGTTTTQVLFQVEVPTHHTVFSVCKYRETGSKGRIIQGRDYNGVFGFWCVC